MKELRNASRVGRLRFLTEENKRDIYLAALAVLGDVGMKVYHDEAKAMLVEAGCTVTPADRVLVPRHLVERARLSVPPVVTVYDRGGEPAMELGGYNTYFGTGSDLMSTYDLETGVHRPSVLEDVKRAARLCDALPHIDFIMSSAHPTDVNPHHAYLLSFQAMMENSTKPLVVTAENAGDLAVMIAVAAELRGGLEALGKKPYFVVYNEPISPLEHPVESVDKLLLCADTGVPSIYSPAPLAGATAPITVAGHTAQGVAESLFGLVIHQLRRPGAPFLFGIGPAVLDLVTAQSSYNAVEYLMTYMCAVEMAKWLDIPNWGYAGTSDSQLLDAQAGLEAAELTLLAMQAGSNLNHDVGYLDFGLTCSLEEIVVVDEFIAMNRRLLRGIEVDRDTLAVEAIAEAGPGGHYMTSEHTYRYMRVAQWRPSLLNRRGREKWLAEGGLDLAAKARQKALDLLAGHQVPGLPAAVAAKAEELIGAFTGTSA
ncbi:MAG: trimethylamine methyltransferase family protein [Actinobacteria bacterium]|nr:trimethylamine methyltransferase family protein [Actinomycetota bacterium]